MSLWHPNLIYLPKLEKYYDGTIGAGASYIPADAGLFHAAANLYISGRSGCMQPQYYNAYAGVWYRIWGYDYETFGTFIGDGANFRFYNDSTITARISIMRCL